MFTYQGIDINWTGHDGFRIGKGPLTVYIDPFKLDDAAVTPASIVLVTHEHFDHCSVEDLRKVVNERTVIVCPHECMSAVGKLTPGKVEMLGPGDSRTVQGVRISAVAAYNTNKYRDKEHVFHPKEDEKLGYVLDLGPVIYHAGDTDQTEEMDAVKCDLALLPVSGTYVMTAEEAAKAAKKLNPKVAIPMHYGSIVGKESDAERFKKLLEGTDIRVEIPEKV